MQKILLSFGLLSCLAQAYAADCVQDICLREIVIDGNNRIGVVSSIETSINGSSIKFTESSSGYTYTSTYERLSKKISSARFPEGSFVLDGQNHVGTVKMAFANGKVSLTEESTSYSYITDSVAPEVAELANGTRAGLLVIDANDRIGKALHVFANGKGQFKESSTSYNYVSASLNPEISELNGLKKDAFAIDANNRVGKVEAVFKNGKAFYRDPDSRYTYISLDLSAEIAVLENGLKPGMLTIDGNDRIGNVLHTFANQKAQFKQTNTGYNYIATSPSPEIPELGGLSKGVVVLDSNNRVGKIITIFANKKAHYVETSSGYSYISASLTPEVPAVAGISKNTRIIDTNNRIGITNYVFKDGRLQFTESSTGYAYITSKASPQVDRIGTLQADLIVLDDNNRVGKIAYLFSNGQIVHKELSSGYQYIVTSVSPEVDSSDTYNKTDDYSSVTYRVGKVKRFFANKKIEFSAEGYSFIVAELFSEVNEFKTYLPEQKIIDVQGDEGMVKKVFANGAVLYEAKKKLAGDRQATLHAFSAKIFAANDKELASDQTNWITGIAQTLAEEGTFFPSFGYISLIIKDEDYADLKADLLEFLKKHDNIIYDQKLRKQVLKYLGDTDTDDNNTNPPVNGVVSVRLNDAAYTLTLEKLLNKKKIKYEFTRTEELKFPALTVTVTKLKSTLFVHKCAVKMSFMGADRTAQASLTKTTWSLKKTACESVVKKAFSVLNF
ncbi:MAG: hypothetical protein A2X86_08335 [Bdellovibrionales bacterium GWA2_49_15]|nr:MAG: hypothetical protein A2X86_08335 [Bdellovibrionales bacterium GWA2_49_15]HAZ11231.1 hypothetical protein [Bdellovibrionales bacterium]